MTILTDDEILPAVRIALAEDVGEGDVTTLATVPPSLSAKAVMVAREACVMAGLAVAEAVFRELSSGIRFSSEVEDGDGVEAGTVLLEVQGMARAILTGERVALNFVQRLAAVATQTRRYVEAVRGTRAMILDTRKTTPGLRRLEKYAVVCGGGRNHRFGLFDAVLIKDNHLLALRDAEPNPVAAAVCVARAQYPEHSVEVEADTLMQVEQAVAAGADIVLLDNMTLPELREAVERTAGRVRTEASGGVTLESVRAIAETGVDFISVGGLTHSAPSVDVALELLPPAEVVTG